MYQYLQIDLSEDHIIYGVATQGRSDFGQWVKTYQLEYSEDGSETWKYYQVDGTVKVFNHDTKLSLQTALALQSKR